ncbi:hypothetical protein MASR1M90_13780 [Desulfovibrionales bacterium]
MNCTQCGCDGITEELIMYQMECRNHLFCFEEVPAPKCPECGHVTISEESLSIMLAKIDQLTQKATISYHRCRWPKSQTLDDQAQMPTQAAAELVETINKSVRTT